MLQFIPFDDRWFDSGDALPGPLVPYHVGVPCAHFVCKNVKDHCAAEGTSVKLAVSPSRMPSFEAASAFSSST